MDRVLDKDAIRDGGWERGSVEPADGFQHAQGALMAPEKKSQVLFNSGSLWDPDGIDTVLRVMSPKMHEVEQRTGLSLPLPSTSRGIRRKTVMSKPNARRVYETEVESEQEQDATEEDELVEDTAQDDSDGEGSEVRSAAETAFFAGWCAKQKTADIRKARGFQDMSLSPTTNAGGEGADVAGDDRPRDHRDDPRLRNSRFVACGNIGLVTDSVCQKAKSTDTRVRRNGDQTATRKYPVHWSGTSTSQWEMDAGETSESDRRRRHNIQCESSS